MNDEYPEVPTRLTRALRLSLDEAEILEVWQALCDEFGQDYGHEFTISITVRIPEEDE